MFEYLAHQLVPPINHSLLLITCGLLLLMFFKKTQSIFLRWTGRSLIILPTIWLLVCSQYFFSYLLIAPLENANPVIKVSDEEWRDASYIWVLGCYHYDTEKLPAVSQYSHCSLERLVHAASMYHQKSIPIILTGAKFDEDDEYSHAAKSMELLVALGVAEEDIVVIEVGHNTLEEADAVNASGVEGRIAIVSSATHGIRLAYLMRQRQLEFVFIPVHFANSGENKFNIHLPSANALIRSERALYEFAAIINTKYL